MVFLVLVRRSLVGSGAVVADAGSAKPVAAVWIKAEAAGPSGRILPANLPGPSASKAALLVETVLARAWAPGLGSFPLDAPRLDAVGVIPLPGP